MTLKENYAEILINVDKIHDILWKYKLAKMTIGKKIKTDQLPKIKLKKTEKC